MYIGRARIELPPHVFAVAESAYRSMVNEKENQCVIIRYRAFSVIAVNDFKW